MILLVSMLAGIMTFSGCVDDKESPSVTAVRQAKAAQLNAIAAYQNALAAKEQAMADTENALREAKVAYQQALAERAQAEADQAKAAAEERMAQAQNEIQRLANELEKMAVQQKIDMLDLQTQYETALKDADDATAQLLGGLFTAYSTAANNLLDAQQKLAKANVELAQLQAGLVNGEEAKQMAINGQKRIIAQNEENIANQKAMLEIYEAQKAPAEAKEELTAAKNELASLQQAKNDANKALGKAYENSSDAFDHMLGDPDDSSKPGQKYKDLAEKITSSYFQMYHDENGNAVGSFNEYIYLMGYTDQVLGKDVEATVGTYWFKATDAKDVTTYTAVMNKLIGKQLVKVQSVDGIEESKEYWVYTSYYQLNEAGVKVYLDSISSKINNGDLGKDLAAAKKDLVDKQKEIADLEKATPKDEAAIDAAKAELPGLQTSVNVAQAALDKANAQLAAIKANFDEMAAQAENWTSAVEAYNAASEATVDASFAADAAADAVTEQESKITALQAVVDGSVVINGTTYTVEGAIQYAENQIKIANQNIQNAQKQIASIQNQSNPGEITQQAIELKQQEIANLEAQIPVLQQIADKAKATLDAATAAQGE